MSTPVGTHGLSCIGDEDYAAYALTMQCNAQAADAAMAASQGQLGDYLDRPWIEVVNANIMTIDDTTGGGNFGPFGIVGGIMRPGNSDVITTVNKLPPAYLTSDASTRWPSGTYLIGANINWTLASATASSIRRLMVYGLADIAGRVTSYETFYDLYEAIDYQGDGGNSGALSVCGLVQSVGELAVIESMFAHGNIAGDLTVAAGQWRLWAMYMGSGLVV